MENIFYRVIVCGTNFGRIYIEGITRKTTKCKLVGILSKGSQQSRKCAESNGVPLYTNVSQISSSEVDIVCVAVKSSITGGKGTEIAKECLKKRNKRDSRATSSFYRCEGIVCNSNSE